MFTNISHVTVGKKLICVYKYYVRIFPRVTITRIDAISSCYIITFPLGIILPTVTLNSAIDP